MRYPNGFIIVLLLMIPSLFWAQEKQLRAYLNERQFYAPEEGTYLEVQLHFAGHTLRYLSQDSTTYGEVEIAQIFSQNDTVISYDKYVLKSPLVIDSIVEDFHDIQRYSLPPGTYDYELSIQDIHADHPPVSVSKSIEIREMSGRVEISDLAAAESIRPSGKQSTVFSKIGYDVVPMVTNYYPTELKKLPYYVEVYNTKTHHDDSVYVVEQKIVGANENVDLSGYTRYYRYKESRLQPIAKYVDISTLPTGAYELQLNVLNREKEVVASQSFNFDRNNAAEVDEVAFQSTVLDPAFEESIPNDSTGYYVASLIPIARSSEVKNIIQILKQKDNDKNQKYLQAFWKSVNPENPYEGWIKYKKQVHKVEKLFATNYQVGFETDRGRVYLEYGPPNQLTERPSSPSEYPYEIWQYDKIGRFSNRRFVFYSPTNLNKDYRLLHSDMVGELQNYRWRYALNKRNTPDSNLDNPRGSGYQQHFGGNSSLYYNSY